MSNSAIKLTGLICEECGRQGLDVEVWNYIPYDATTIVHLCPSCALKDGFCLNCRNFVLGSGDEQTLEATGRCAECQ